MYKLNIFCLLSQATCAAKTEPTALVQVLLKSEISRELFCSVALLTASCLQCFDTVGWAAGRASGCEKIWGDDGGGHCLVQMEWRRTGWSVCLPLLIFRCTIKSRSSLSAPVHPVGPGKRAVKRLWWCGGVILCVNFELYRLQLSVTSYLFVEHLYSVNQNVCSSMSQVNERQVFTLTV